MNEISAIELRPPLDEQTVEKLRAGDRVRITGTLLTARDAAHRRLVEARRAGEPLPVDVRGQIIYYVGPTPAPPGRVVGAAGPTTAGRMDVYTPELLAAGLKAMIGKGFRSAEVIAALARCRAVYLGAVGGAGALLAQHIRRAEVVAYADLGPEAIRRLEVVDFPAYVINDCHGGDLYREGQREWAARLAGGQT
jgi:fumarate hydratase subunit beta